MFSYWEKTSFFFGPQDSLSEPASGHLWSSCKGSVDYKFLEARHNPRDPASQKCQDVSFCKAYYFLAYIIYRGRAGGDAQKSLVFYRKKLKAKYCFSNATIWQPSDSYPIISVISEIDTFK